MVVVWVVLGIALLGFELHHLAFFAVFGAIGSFAAALVAAIAPDAYVAQVVAAVVVAVLGTILVRPYVSRALERRSGDGHVARGVHGGLVGQEVLTLDEVGDPLHPGHVRLAGESWLAISGSGSPIPAKTGVVVTSVQGTTLVVWPAGALGLELPIDGPGGALPGPESKGTP